MMDLSHRAKEGARTVRPNGRLPAAILAAGALLLLAACQTMSASRPGETVAYTSSNIDFFRDVFAGRLNDDSVTLKGRLFLPEGDRPFPVVVWQHGSGQPYNRNYASWRSDLRDELAAEGIGFFIADSYSGRGIGETTRDQSQLSGASRVTDALRALEALARHPRIDPARIGIAGTSWGGAVAARTSHEPFAAALLPGGPRFAAHVPFYPACGGLFELYGPTGAPLLFLIGGADNYTSPERCMEQVENMKRAGADVQAVVYPGAHHGFISSRPVYRHRAAWTFIDCGGSVLGRDGEVRGRAWSSEGRTFPQLVRQVIATGCPRRGVNIGRNEDAARDALDRTVAFFAEHLRT